MIFKVTFDNKSIGDMDYQFIESLDFKSSIYTINSIAVLKIKDITNTIFNLIKTGMKVSITFTDDKKDNAASKSYVNKMAVYSFKKIPGAQMADYIELTLVSDIYFEDKVETVAHKGTVSQIIQKICKDNYSSYTYNWFNSNSNSSSVSSPDDNSDGNSDDMVRYRYQLSERNLDFIKRILKYGTIKETPIFFYSDPMGCFNLKSEYDLRKEEPKYYFIPVMVNKLQQKFDISDTLIEVLMSNYEFINAPDNFASSITSKFSTDLFKSPTDFETEKKSLGIEDKNAQCENVSPPRVDYYGWELTPTDAFSIAVRNNYMSLKDTYYLNITVASMAVDELKLGSIVWVLLHYNPTATSSTGQSINCGEGQYMVQEVIFHYSRGVSKTQAKLVQVAY